MTVTVDRRRRSTKGVRTLTAHCVNGNGWRAEVTVGRVRLAGTVVVGVIRAWSLKGGSTHTITLSRPVESFDDFCAAITAIHAKYTEVVAEAKGQAGDA